MPSVVIALVLMSSAFSLNNTAKFSDRPFSDCLQKSSQEINVAKEKCLERLEMNASVKNDIINLERKRLYTLSIPEAKKEVLRSMNNEFMLNLAYLDDQDIIKFSTASQIDLLKLEDLDLSTLQQISKLNLNEYLKLMSIPLSKFEKFESPKEIRSLLSTFAIQITDPNKYQRRISKEEFEAFEREYLKKKLEYLREKEKVLQIKAQLSKSREKYLSCQEADKTCQAEKEGLVKDIKHYIEGILMLSELQLQRISSRMGSADKISALEYSKASDKIDSQIDKIYNLRSSIISMHSTQELKDAKSEISKIWDESQSIAKLYATTLLMTRITDILEQSTKSHQKMACLATLAKTQNQENENMVENYNNYHLLLANAQSKIIKAKKSLESFETSESNDMLLLQIKTDTLEAYYLLSKAHMDFKESIRTSQRIGLDIQECEKFEGDATHLEFIEWCDESESATITKSYTEVCE